MSRYLARILRAIIVAVLGAGGGVGLLTFIVFVIYSDQSTAVEMALMTALVVGLGFGLVIAAILLFTDLTMRLAASAGHYDEIWELEQTRNIEILGSLKDAKRYCREALLAVPNLKSVSEDTEKNVMKASVGKSWRSPGEVVSINIEPVDADHWKLTCTSKCTQANVSFDYAKNYENVETWLRKLREVLATSAPRSGDPA